MSWQSMNVRGMDIRWNAQWIGHPADIPVGGDPLGQADPIADYVRRTFRRCFVLDRTPTVAPLRLFADSRYSLWVNGALVGRGPVRSQPRRARADHYDIAGFLVGGANVIEVIVTYYGRANSFWQPARPNGVLGGRPVLVLEGAVGGTDLSSDESWNVCLVSGVSAAPTEGFHGIPVEIVDARLSSVSDSDVHDWVGVGILRAEHFGGQARSNPPTDPYGPLLPRPIGDLGGETVVPVTVFDLGVVPPVTFDHPVRSVKVALKEIGAQPRTEVRADVAIGVLCDTNESRLLRLDFGRIVCGYVEMAITAPSGAIIDVMYAEREPDPELEQAISPVTGARYVARGQADVFQAEEPNGFRYAFLRLTTGVPDKIALERFWVHESVYPYSGEALFATSDTELSRLYEVGRRTVALNSRDAFTDCPTREQRAWVGDGVVHQMVHLTTSSDWRPARWYVELGNAPRYDGMLPRSVVGDMEYTEAVSIPDWALNWVHGVWNLYRYDGDRQAILNLLPTVHRVLGWYVPYLGADGLLNDVPEWNLADWSAVFVNATSSIINGLWGRALREYSEMSEFVNNVGSVDWATGMFTALTEGFEQFWDADRGTYVDQLVDGVKQSPASQLAGACAIVSGVAPRARWDSVATWIGEPGHLVTRSWIGGNGGYDDVKIAAHLRGEQPISWDAQREAVRAEPFGSYLVHDALAAARRCDLLLVNLRRWSRFLADGYDTFGECWGWGTPAHGWSSTPTRDIVQYLVGVTPAEPGFAMARVAPALDVLSDFEAAVPTPQGTLWVKATENELSVTAPIPFILNSWGEAESFHQSGSVTVRRTE